jgi:hypothetical protein
VNSPGLYAFPPAAPADLPMLRSWLETPEARRRWGDPAGKEGLLREDMDNPRMTMPIMTWDGAPVVAIDPDLDNRRARRACARAGFADDQIVETGEGEVMLMLFAAPPPAGELFMERLKESGR